MAGTRLLRQGVRGGGGGTGSGVDGLTHGLKVRAPCSDPFSDSNVSPGGFVPGSGFTESLVKGSGRSGGFHVPGAGRRGHKQPQTRNTPPKPSAPRAATRNGAAGLHCFTCKPAAAHDSSACSVVVCTTQPPQVLPMPQLPPMCCQEAQGTRKAPTPQEQDPMWG